MFQLVIAVMSIGLMALMMTVGVQYINPLPAQAQQVSTRLEHGLLGLKKGFDNYVDEKGVAPLNLSDFTPHYAFVPASSSQSSIIWSYKRISGSTGAAYLCFKPIYPNNTPFPPAYTGAFIRLKKVLSPQAYFINTTCGATSNAYGSSSPQKGNTFKGSITYWLAR